MTEAGSPITKVIEQVKNQSIAGLGKDWEFKEPIKLELSTIISGKAGGNIDIKVVNFGAKVEATQIQKMNFSIGPKDEAEQEEKKARIAKAKHLQKYPHHDIPNSNK